MRAKNKTRVQEEFSKGMEQEFSLNLFLQISIHRIYWTCCFLLRPAELQRVSGEHADSLLGQREELAPS